MVVIAYRSLLYLELLSLSLVNGQTLTLWYVFR
jgi:hypothetical protein